MTNIMSTADLRSRLDLLHQERAAALAEGLGDNPLYMGDLDAEIAATRSAYVGIAVTEIASLRAQLSGPLQG